MTCIPQMRSLALLALFAVPAQLLAQDLQIGNLYKCANGQSGLKVTKCSGGNPDVCDVELYRDGKLLNTVQLPKANLGDLMRICQGAAPPAAAAPGAANPGQVDANGFRLATRCALRRLAAGTLARSCVQTAMLTLFVLAEPMSGRPIPPSSAESGRSTIRTGRAGCSRLARRCRSISRGTGSTARSSPRW